MARIICDYCGTEYDDTMQRCPLCGTVNETAAEEEPAREERPDRQRNRQRKAGAHAAPNSDKIPKWLSILICVVLGIAVVIGALYAMYALGMLSPKKSDPDQPSLTLPITQEEDPAPDQGEEEAPQPTDEEDSGEVLCTGLTVSPASIRLDSAGISAAVSASAQPAGCTEAITWSTSDPAVCTVDEDGIVTSVDGGTATVTAACGRYTAEVTVNCEFANSRENNASLSTVDFTLFSTGEQATISVLNAPEGASITWSSSNTNVCTVSGGVVTAVKAGTATVTADVNGKKLECIVRCNIEGSVVATDDNAEVAGGYALDHQDVTLGVGESFEISVVGGVSGGWSVSDASVISVDGNGIVSALSSGTASVYTTVAGQRLECIVRVK